MRNADDGRFDPESGDKDPLAPLLAGIGRAETNRYERELECEQTITELETLAEQFPPSHPIETQIVGEYSLIELLGRGGMGTVFKAEHRRLGKTFAFKTITPSLSRDGHANERFQREVRAAGSIDHDHVVAATDAGEHDGVQYLVMEFIDGVDLRRLVSRTGPLGEADACELARQAAIGLQAIHQHGLVHRDIKPSNLMLDSSGRVKITDLGLALLHESQIDVSTENTSFVGTAAYTAPEQRADSAAVDKRADIYSLGLTLRFLMTGVSNSEDSSPDRSTNETLENRNEGKLARILRRCLAEAPEQRFETAAELAEALVPFSTRADLEAILAEYGLERSSSSAVEMGSRREVDAWQRIRNWFSSNQSFVAVIGITALVLTAFAYASTFLGDRSASDDAPLASIQTIDERAALERAERETAEWVLSRRGALKLYPRGDITQLSELPERVQIQNILMPRREVTDEDMKWFLQVANLQTLEINANLLSNDALETLSQITTLRWLYLDSNQEIDDAGVEHLQSLSRLQSLGLSATSVTDACVSDLRAMPLLRELKLGYTGITSACLEPLSECTNLVRVDLSGTVVGDDGLEHLRNLSRLKFLYLAGTEVTDAAVSDLIAIATLRELSVKNTVITPSGVSELRQALPECRITY